MKDETDFLQGKFCKEHNFTVINTWFRNHPRRCWTWKSPGDRTRNQIDFILFQERFRNALTQCKSMHGAHCGNNHVPVVGTMRINLKITTKLQLNMYENGVLMNKHSISVKNKFSALGQLTTAGERWQMMKESILECVKLHIPVTKRKEDKKWREDLRNFRPNG